MATFIHSIMSNNNTFDIDCQIRSETLLDTVPFRAKIDTGCAKTMLSLNLLYTDKTAEELRDIALHIFRKAFKEGEIRYGIGIESSSGSVVHAKTPEEALDNVHIRANILCNNLIINDCILGAHKISIAYKLRDQALIGMEILKDMCTYIGPYQDRTHFISSRKAFFNTERLMKIMATTLKNPENPDAEYIDYSEEDIRANYIQHKLKNQSE